MIYFAPLNILTCLWERAMQSNHPDNLAHGLAADMATYRALQFKQETQKRRRLVAWLGGSALAPILSACGGGSTTAVADTTPVSDTTPVGAGTCTTVPSETAGPYPGDGTNSANGSIVNVLTQSGVVRQDMTGSFGTATGTASGVPLTVRLTLANTSASCAVRADHAIYLWHCDALGRYSLYSSGATSANYLRAVQVSNTSGVVEFTTIFPGCYSGRWPHMHFEVYSSLSSATSGNNDIKTSQLALPASVCNAVYATSGYTGSAANFAGVSLASDGIFSDGVSTQLATVTGSVSTGYVATLQISV
jgi:protocatechuate 3,4-dioxygenase beta subunit